MGREESTYEMLETVVQCIVIKLLALELKLQKTLLYCFSTKENDIQCIVNKRM